MQWAFSSSFRTFHATAFSYETGLPMLDKQMPPGRVAKPCRLKHVFKASVSRKRASLVASVWLLTWFIISGNSEQMFLRPWSSNIFSREMSWSATRVVSSMSTPAWFANVKSDAACRSIAKKKDVDNHEYTTYIWISNFHTTYRWVHNIPSFRRFRQLTLIIWVSYRTFIEQHIMASEWCHSSLRMESFPPPRDLRSSTPIKLLERNKFI